MTVIAAHRWPSNAELIEDCARLGYLKDEWTVLDPTFGRGVWWKRWQPNLLIAHDQAIDGTDFRSLAYPDGFFDAVAYDPPYVCKGGRATTTMPEFQERYGMTDAPSSPAELQALINDGLTEMRRVVRVGGMVLVKCQDYVSSGRLWPGTHLTLTHALTLGFHLIDRLEHIGSPRPQPGGRRQVHARRNLSTLFVLRAVATSPAHG